MREKGGENKRHSRGKEPGSHHRQPTRLEKQWKKDTQKERKKPQVKRQIKRNRFI